MFISTVGLTNTDISISALVPAPLDSIIIFTISITPTPLIIPIYPKIVVITNDSITIERSIERGFAPNALRIPISLVRSLTVILMILLTPTTPEINIAMPMTQIKMLIVLNILRVSNELIISLSIHTPRLSSGEKSWMAAIFRFNSVLKASLSSFVFRPLVVKVS